jgi:hypothetical protein
MAKQLRLVLKQPNSSPDLIKLNLDPPCFPLRQQLFPYSMAGS